MNTQEKFQFSNLKFPVLLVLNIVFFFYVLPLDVVHEYLTMLAIVGGLITLTLSIWTVGKLMPVLFEKIPIISGLACVCTFFVFGYFLISQSVNQTTDELIKYGTTANATVIDKTSISAKRKDMTSIDAVFKVENGEEYTVTFTVTEKMYEQFKVGMTIPIIYSSEHPEVARIRYQELMKDGF